MPTRLVLFEKNQRKFSLELITYHADVLRRGDSYQRLFIDIRAGARHSFRRGNNFQREEKLTMHWTWAVAGFLVLVSSLFLLRWCWLFSSVYLNRSRSAAVWIFSVKRGLVVTPVLTLLVESSRSFIPVNACALTVPFPSWQLFCPQSGQ